MTTKMLPKETNEKNLLSLVELSFFYLESSKNLFC